MRTTLIGGKDKMLVWNDLEADEKIKVYDKGVEITNGEDVYDLLVSYRSGDVWAPKVDQTEALKVELDYFVDCILNDRTPINDGAAGLRVVRLLEAADQSLKERGKVVPLNHRCRGGYMTDKRPVPFLDLVTLPRRSWKTSWSSVFRERAQVRRVHRRSAGRRVRAGVRRLLRRRSTASAWRTAPTRCGSP